MDIDMYFSIINNTKQKHMESIFITNVLFTSYQYLDFIEKMLNEYFNGKPFDIEEYISKTTVAVEQTIINDIEYLWEKYVNPTFSPYSEVIKYSLPTLMNNLSVAKEVLKPYYNKNSQWYVNKTISRLENMDFLTLIDEEKEKCIIEKNISEFKENNMIDVNNMTDVLKKDPRWIKFEDKVKETMSLIDEVRKERCIIEKNMPEFSVNNMIDILKKDRRWINFEDNVEETTYFIDHFMRNIWGTYIIVTKIIMYDLQCFVPRMIATARFIDTIDKDKFIEFMQKKYEHNLAICQRK